MPKEKLRRIVTNMETKKHRITHAYCTYIWTDEVTNSANKLKQNHLKYNIRNAPIIVLVPNKFSFGKFCVSRLVFLSAVAWINKWFLFSCRTELAAISNKKSHCLSAATQIAVFDILYALMLQVLNRRSFSLSQWVCVWYNMYANWLVANRAHILSGTKEKKKKGEKSKKWTHTHIYNTLNAAFELGLLFEYKSDTVAKLVKLAKATTIVHKENPKPKRNT